MNTQDQPTATLPPKRPWIRRAFIGVLVVIVLVLLVKRAIAPRRAADDAPAGVATQVETNERSANER